MSMMAAGILLLGNVALAGSTYIVPNGTIDVMASQYSDGTTTVTSTDTSDPDGAQFTGSTTAATGWWNIGIGTEWIFPNGLDLTGYDTVRMKAENKASTYVWLESWVNAGWVPTPGDVLAISTSQWVAPGASTILDVDLSGYSATYLGQVTKIGVQVGGYASDPSWDFDGVSPVATGFDVLVTPEPATLGLLALGGVAALIRRRRSA